MRHLSESDNLAFSPCLTLFLCNTRHKMDLHLTLLVCVHVYSQAPGHQAVFINEPRLSDFKQVLLREGIQAEFVGGVLVCNNMVAVRRVRLLHLLLFLIAQYQRSYAQLGFFHQCVGTLPVNKGLFL